MVIFFQKRFFASSIKVKAILGRKKLLFFFTSKDSSSRRLDCCKRPRDFYLSDFLLLRKVYYD